MVEVLNHGHLERRRRRKALLVLAASPHPFRIVLLTGVQSRRFHACLLEVASCRACVHPETDRGSKCRRARQDGLGRLFWPCASHGPIHHFAVTSRAARIDASSQILAPDDSPPRPPFLGRTTARLHRRDNSEGTHRYRNRAPLAREMAASRRKILSNTGSVHRPPEWQEDKEE